MRNSNLMATLQAGPPGWRKMSIFITKPPHSTSIWEGGRQATCPYIPCTLSLQPKKMGSEKGKQFPWNIRIKRTWKERKGWRGKLITQKWIRNIGEKRRAGSSGGRGGGGAGLNVLYENGCMQDAAWESKAISALCVLHYPVWKSSAITSKIWHTFLQDGNPRRQFAFHSFIVSLRPPLRPPLKASMILELGCCTVLEWYGAYRASWLALWRVNPKDRAQQGHIDSSAHNVNKGGRVLQQKCNQSSQCSLKQHICCK